MTVHSYKSGGKVSRSLSDYRDQTVGSLNVSYTLEDWWEEQYQTITIAETSVAANNYGNISQYGSHGIGSKSKGNGEVNNNQVASGGILIVGERGPLRVSGSAEAFPVLRPNTNIFCGGGICIYSYEAGNVSETVGQHGSSVINMGIGARKISSFQFVFDTWQPISRFVGAAECRAYVYEPCITEDYIELDYGLISANHTNTIDNGLITTNTAVVEDRGHILDRYKTRFGFKKVIGEAQARATNAWIGSGRLKSFGSQTSPAIYGWITDGKVKHLPTLFRVQGSADAAFSITRAGGGLTPLSGTATIGITAGYVGDGSLRKFGGLAESATWNPLEKQILFSFVGGLTSEKHVESYRGSGRIRNLATVKAVKGIFDYVGSGSFKLNPRKPDRYLLEDLANFTLEIDTGLASYWQGLTDPNDNWHQTKKLGAVQLHQLREWAHEKHTEVYTQSSFVPYSEVDYGYLINQNVSNCTAASGTISTNTTASTGCIKVAPGTTLAIAPSNTYTIPAIQTTPSTTIDYGLVTDSAAPTIDHGWILGERSDLRTPYGLFKITSTTDVVITKQFHFTSDGTPPLFKITGQTALPLDVSEYGDGRLFGIGGASEAVSNVKVGTGLFKLLSLTDTSRARDFVGSGRIPVFTGAAESTTWNPEEKQMLFSILGVGTESHTEVFVGSGNLFTFSGASESTTYVPTSHGLFRFEGDSHDTRTRVIVGSGSFKKFSGLSESVTFNPLEKQLLFSINGVGTEKHTESYVGSGKIRKLSGSAESVRWSAQHTTGLYRISGDSTNIHTRDFVGSGRIPIFTGAAESLTFNPTERDMLFSFIGGITSEKHTESYVGSGFLRNFATVELRQTFDWIGSGSIKLNPRKPETYELSELSAFTLELYSLNNAYINLGNLDFYTDYTQLGHAQLKWLSYELSHEKHTEAYNNGACEDGVELDYGNLVNQNLSNCVANSGTISTNTTAANGCIKVAPTTTLVIAPGVTYTIPNQLTTPTDSEDYGLVSNTNAPEWRDYGHILDSLSKVCPFGAFEITGTAKTHFVENIVSTGYSVTGKAGVNIYGAGDTFWQQPYIADGLFRIGGSRQNQSFTPAPEIGSGSIRKLGGAAETIANVEKADGLFRISGASTVLFSLLHPGSGLIRITGTGGESITPATHVGSGSLKKFSGAAESTTWNPQERDLLFSFTGVGSEKFIANPPEEGTEVRISGNAFPVFFIPEYPGSGLIRVTGEGLYSTTNQFVGSGSFKKFSGAAESLTFNPEERQLLFSFTGTGEERVTLNPPEEGTNIRLRGEGVYKLDSSYLGSGTISISGDALSKTTNPFVGSGSLKKFSGAAESITFNPEERQLLFSFTGTGSENTTTIESGSGRLFTVGGSVSSTAAAYESTGLFKIGGFTKTSRSGSHIGFGSLKKFSGAAESVTYNPDEKQLLFSFTGSAEDSRTSTDVGSGRIAIYPEASDYRFTPNWNSVGGVRIEIQSAYRFAPVWIGSGSLKKFSGAAESITFNPEEKQLLFSFTGTGSESTTTKTIVKGGTIRLDGTPRVRWVPNNIGSGTIFVSGTAKTHYVPDIEGTGGLWTWNGAAESQAIAITSIPTLFRVYGNGDIARSRPYIGSGSLKKFQGAAESLTFNPDEKQMLFSFLGQGTTTRTRSESGQGTVKTLGESTVRFSPVYFGSGTTRVSGEVYVTRSRDFVGFGSLRKLSGAAESLTFNPEEKQMLFSFLGVGAESRTSRELSQSGVLTVRGTSGDPLLTFAEQPTVEIDITGDSYDLRAHAYQGSGRISNVNNADPSFSRAGYKGSGRIALSGVAFVQVVVWQPPHTQVWII